MLAQTDIDRFHRDGFLVLRGFFSGDELRMLQEEATKVEQEGISFQADQVDAGRKKHHSYRQQEDKSFRYFRSEEMWQRHPIFQAVTVNPKLLQSIGQCVGEGFVPANDSFVCKTPHSDVPIHWHQDPPYSNPKSSETLGVPNFDVDIYLQPSTIENGCVWGIPAHHLVGHVDIARFSEEELFNNFGAVPIEMEPGDVLFHCLSAPHGSVGNTTADTRSIFYVHYMARDVAKVSYKDADWILQGKGFVGMATEAVPEMMEHRRSFGWDGIENPDYQISLAPEGIQFNGRPCSPPRHWDTLIQQMSPEEIEQKQNLAFTAAAAIDD